MEVGVVIGRFQVADLHEGHRYLINEAFRNHRKVIILIGCPVILGTKYDPLDFPTRERMLRAAYPDAIILPVYDCLDDKEWSKNVDRAIRGIVPNLTGARLYGGRDSFKAHYHGEFIAVDVDSGIRYQKGGDQREDIGKVVRSSSDFRAGIIYSTQNSWPYVKMCADIACVKKTHLDATANGVPKYIETYDILLGRKPNENKWRLPGGMVDKGESIEECASRELLEETNISIPTEEFKYVGSFPVSDWRFKNAGEIGLLTGLCVANYEYTSGKPEAKDDLAELKWCPIELAEDEVMKGHKALISALRRFLNVK